MTAIAERHSDQAVLPRWHFAATLPELEVHGRKTVHVDGRIIVVCRHEEEVYALDNRCPHMGFPLDRGTCRDGILTCHWHSARFDLKTGGTFDQWADDAQVFPVQLRGNEVWVDTAVRRDQKIYYRTRLRDGLERNIPLLLAKSAIALLEGGGEVQDPLSIALDFGTTNRQMGWGRGLTMLTCFANIAPYLLPEDRPLAIYQGLSAVALEVADTPPHFVLTPLPGEPPDVPTLKRWLREFTAVRDEEGAERVVVSAVRAGASAVELADMLLTAATDYRYIDVGHTLDFINKAFEALDLAGWEPQLAEAVLSSVVRGIAQGSRQEESNAWRRPIDLVSILEEAFPQITGAIEQGRPRQGTWKEQVSLANKLLEDDPKGNVAALLEALRAGATEEELGCAVTYSAALRIAQFSQSNEFTDWDTALHTFTFAHAVYRGLHRAPSPELLRGVFDAAMSVYLDRFLNVPPARIPQLPTNGNVGEPNGLLNDLLEVLNRQQQVNRAGELVARYLASGGSDAKLLSTLGKALVREDRNFHTIQTVEAAFSLYRALRGTPQATHALIAAARYLAAHVPTPRAQAQTYTIALRLHRGDHIYED
jgi:nitrite reductase/ring-hydroxylating ferredoxin subunit